MQRNNQRQKVTFLATTAQASSAATAGASVTATAAATTAAATSAVSMPSTTTTVSPRPTPPNPCSNKSCAGTLGYNGTCVVVGTGSTCDCPGNLNPDDSCSSSRAFHRNRRVVCLILIFQLDVYLRHKAVCRSIHWVRFGLPDSTVPLAHMAQA